PTTAPSPPSGWKPRPSDPPARHRPGTAPGHGPAARHRPGTARGRRTTARPVAARRPRPARRHGPARYRPPAGSRRRSRGTHMDLLSKAVLNGAPPEELERIPLPQDVLAGHLRADDAAVRAGESDEDVGRARHGGHVGTPEPAPDEVEVAVMASSINVHTVCSAMFDPISTFTAPGRFARQGGRTTRHDLPHQVVGSDAAG